jgi:hypothetical protein
MKCMEALRKQGGKSIAFPSISCGVCEFLVSNPASFMLAKPVRLDGYPIQDATEIAVETIRSLLEKPEYDEVSYGYLPAWLPMLIIGPFERSRKWSSASSAKEHKRHTRKLCRTSSLQSLPPLRQRPPRKETRALPRMMRKKTNRKRSRMFWGNSAILRAVFE